MKDKRSKLQDVYDGSLATLDRLLANLRSFRPQITKIADGSSLPNDDITLELVKSTCRFVLLRMALNDTEMALLETEV